MRIVIASDHGGFKLKEILVKYLKSKGHMVKDIGAFSEESCDYPIIGYQAAKLVGTKKFPIGILICKTGIGMSMVGNKVRGVRAALCSNANIARASREHNDSNVLVLGADTVSPQNAKKILQAWLGAKRPEGRHSRRVKQIKKIEGLEYERAKKN